ncbi:MAG: hypothetical protein JOZ22_10910 [Acidobacteriia bacterium]|nr:hypothetical protein [Terriglobia bacterium]
MLAALGFVALLLLANAPFVPAWLHSYASALPLAMAGIAYTVLQFRLRPAGAALLKRLLLAATFVTWAIDQILPPGPLATLLGDVVIGAYVLDLYWLIGEQIAAASASSDSGVRRG